MRLTDTMADARRANELLERKAAERDPLAQDPLVRAVLERFPGAELVKVTRRNEA